MQKNTEPPKADLRSMFAKLFLGISILIFVASGCSAPLGGSQDTILQQTQVSLGVQQTMLAERVNQDLQATLGAQQATINAQVMQATLAYQAPTTTPDLAATQVAIAVQATTQAGQLPPANPVQPTQDLPTLAPLPADTSQDVKAFMKTANILLYEDMVADPRVARYVKKTLDTMDLNYKDDGNALGWFKNDLLGGARDGNPWDLVIVAVEDRGNVSGEYFDYILDVLNQGTSVIIEAYHLDQISQGTVSTILAKCGVDVTNYVGTTRSANDILVWPISGVTHPILKDPNAGLVFSKAISFWSYNDLGDLMHLTGRGDAQLLIGRNATDNSRNGVLASCMNGQITLMTFSSHSFQYQNMLPLWENMIYNALKTRMLNKQ